LSEIPRCDAKAGVDWGWQVLLLEKGEEGISRGAYAGAGHGRGGNDPDGGRRGKCCDER